MKLCALIVRGKIAEVSVVKDGHKYGDHGDHYHSDVKVVKESVCPGGAVKEEQRDAG